MTGNKKKENIREDNTIPKIKKKREAKIKDYERR